jgi:hypothetical protein
LFTTHLKRNIIIIIGKSRNLFTSIIFLAFWYRTVKKRTTNQSVCMVGIQTKKKLRTITLVPFLTRPQLHFFKFWYFDILIDLQNTSFKFPMCYFRGKTVAVDRPSNRNLFYKVVIIESRRFPSCLNFLVKSTSIFNKRDAK